MPNYHFKRLNYIIKQIFMQHAWDIFLFTNTPPFGIWTKMLNRKQKRVKKELDSEINSIRNKSRFHLQSTLFFFYFILTAWNIACQSLDSSPSMLLWSEISNSFRVILWVILVWQMRWFLALPNGFKTGRMIQKHTHPIFKIKNQTWNRSDFYRAIFVIINSFL